MAAAGRTKSTPTSTAGIVVWRRTDDAIEILLVHPGGPFWAKKDQHAWSIPKGEFTPSEESAEDAATREFVEEMACLVPDGVRTPLSPFRAGKKMLYAFCVEGDFDTDLITPEDQHRSMVELEWPPRSGAKKRFPEVDRAAWVPLLTARDKLHKGQAPLVQQLQNLLTEH